MLSVFCAKNRNMLVLCADLELYQILDDLRMFQSESNLYDDKRLAPASDRNDESPIAVFGNADQPKNDNVPAKESSSRPIKKVSFCRLFIIAPYAELSLFCPRRRTTRAIFGHVYVFIFGRQRIMFLKPIKFHVKE